MYSLEQVDDENKRRQSAMGNISASNDPQQQVHDRNEQLIKGAEVLGAGRTLGLTDDETLDTKRATMQREQRSRRAQRGERAGNEAAAREFLAQDDAKYTFVGKPEEDSEYPDPFGTFKEDKVVSGRVVPAGAGDPSEQENAQAYSREEKVRFDVLPEEFLNEREIRAQREGRARPTVQMQSGADQRERGRKLRDRDREQGIKAAAEERRRFRGDLTPSEIDREVEKRIAARTPSPDVKNPSMPVNLRRDIAEELLARHERNESGGFEFQKMLNDRKAAKEAGYIASRGRGLPRQLADEDIGRIDEIRSLGNASSVGHGDNSPGNIQVVRTDSPANFEQAVQMVGPEGQIVGYADQQVSHFLGDVNADGSDNVLNAPLSAGQKFVVDNLPDYGREGGTSFGDKGVSIMAELQQFGDRMRGLQGYGYDDFSKNPRSVEEIEKAVGNIIGRGQEMGDAFYTFDTEGNKTVASSDPGFNEVLYKMRYSEPEKQRLAYALQQLQMADLSPVNQEQKAAFKERRPMSSIKDDVIFDAPEFKPDGDSALAKIKNEKVGRGKKAKSVRSELAQLPTPGAAMPFYGAAAGEPVPRARFIRGKDRGKSESELVEKYGAQGLVGAEVERRYKEDLNVKEAGLSEPDKFALQQRELDSQFEQAGQQAEAQKERSEKLEIARLMTEGASKEGRFELGSTVDGRPRVIEAAPAGRKLVVPSRSQLTGNSSLTADNSERVSKGVFRRTQPIQPASVPTSITPQPGAGTGNQSSPAIDAGRGGWMGGTGSGRVVSPYDKPGGALASLRASVKSAPEQSSSYYDGNNQYDVASAFSDERSRRQSESSSAGFRRVQGPAMSTEPRTRQQRIDQFTNFGRKNKRALGISAAGAGTAAVLAGILGTGDEEEEQY